MELETWTANALGMQLPSVGFDKTVHTCFSLTTVLAAAKFT